MSAKCPQCGSFDVQALLDKTQCLGCGATIIDGEATGGEVRGITTTRDVLVTAGDPSMSGVSTLAKGTIPETLDIDPATIPQDVPPPDHYGETTVNVGPNPIHRDPDPNMEADAMDFSEAKRSAHSVPSDDDNLEPQPEVDPKPGATPKTVDLDRDDDDLGADLDLDAMSKTELTEAAADAEIGGRSSMNKAELIDALRADDGDDGESEPVTVIREVKKAVDPDEVA